MNHRVIRLFLLIFSIIFLVSPNLSAEPTPSSCPAAISSPHLTFTSVPADGGLRAGSITITNSADYPDTLFSCDASGCILVRDIVYEDGTLLLTEGVPNRRELEQKTVILSPDHTGIRVGLYVASCGLSVLSDIIPISYTIPPSAGDEPPTRALTCEDITTPIEQNTDRSGGDMRSIDLTSAEPCACAHLCKDDSNCQAFTYVPPGVQGSNAKCWLKNTASSPSSRTGFVSGVIRNSAHPGYGHYTDCESLPTPRIRYLGSEDYSTDAGMFTRYKISVDNYADFRPALFVNSPDLPACGLNTASSRTWVSILTHDGTYIYGYCAQTSPHDLAEIGFSVPRGDIPPSPVRITVEDRGCGIQSFSNEITIPGGSPTIPGGSEPEHPETTPISCPTSLDSFEMNTDRVGGDFRNEELSSADPCACAELCDADNSCQSFTYVPPGIQGPTAMCWLKNSVPESSAVTGFISGLKTLVAVPESGIERLPAPIQISPVRGSVLSTYPRDLILTWNPVSGAASYSTEIDCYHCCVVNRWCSDVDRSWDIKTGIIGTTQHNSFAGKQKGRWRVWAVDSSGNEGQKSPWWEFEYTI